MKQGDDDNDTVIVEDVLEDDELLEDDEEEADITPEPPGRGMQTRAPHVPYQISFKGKSYPGSLFLQLLVHHYEADFATKGYQEFNEGTALLNMHAGAGYKAQQDMCDIKGVIDLNLGEEPSLPNCLRKHK